jgi:hypothetical protein
MHERYRGKPEGIKARKTIPAKIPLSILGDRRFVFRPALPDHVSRQPPMSLSAIPLGCFAPVAHSSIVDPLVLR